MDKSPQLQTNKQTKVQIWLQSSQRWGKTLVYSCQYVLQKSKSDTTHPESGARICLSKFVLSKSKSDTSHPKSGATFLSSTIRNLRYLPAAGRQIINTKFSPVLVLIRFHFFAKFGSGSSKNRPATPLIIFNFSRVWQVHFLSYILQTWQICFFFVDLQLISVSLLNHCLKV